MRGATLLVLLTVASALAGCVQPPPSAGPPPCPDEPTPEAGAVPACIQRAADEAAVWYLGLETAARMLTPDPDDTQGRVLPPASCAADPVNGGCTLLASRPHYQIAYHLRSPGQPWVDEVATISLELDGHVAIDQRSHWTGEDLTDRPTRHEAVHGLPMCRLQPGECRFIDEAAAIHRARWAGLERGQEPWKASFHWYGDVDSEVRSYVWTVSAVLAEEAGDGDQSGRVAIVDANDGRLHGISRWFTVSN